MTANTVIKHAERFFRKVQKTESCWLWVGRLNDSGYGLFDLNKKPKLAHRISWLLAGNVIPGDFGVLHNCPSGDNPRCVNPAHLWTGTDKDNSDDKVSKGRQAMGPSHRKRMMEVAARGASHMSRTSPQSVRRGQAASGARLTESQVKEIRASYSVGGVFQKQLADKFGVNQSQISDVITRTTWKHVQ